MTLEGVGVTQPNRITYQVRFKFGKQAYCVVEVRRGEEAAEVAKKLRELAAEQNSRRPGPTVAREAFDSCARARVLSSTEGMLLADRCAPPLRRFCSHVGCTPSHFLPRLGRQRGNARSITRTDRHRFGPRGGSFCCRLGDLPHTLAGRCGQADDLDAVASPRVPGRRKARGCASFVLLDRASGQSGRRAADFRSWSRTRTRCVAD